MNPAKQKIAQAMRSLIAHIEANTCTHENTHRGGVLWEICDDCDAKWADDRGGKPQFSEPQCVTNARALLEEFATKPAKDPKRPRPAHKLRLRDGDVVMHVGWQDSPHYKTITIYRAGECGWLQRHIDTPLIKGKRPLFVIVSRPEADGAKPDWTGSGVGE